MVLKPGLEGVPVTNSGICEINGTEGKLNYRGYPISELAQKSSFLETAFLLIWGELPTENELQKFEEDVQMQLKNGWYVEGESPYGSPIVAARQPQNFG